MPFFFYYFYWNTHFFPFYFSYCVYVTIVQYWRLMSGRRVACTLNCKTNLPMGINKGT